MDEEPPVYDVFKTEEKKPCEVPVAEFVFGTVHCLHMTKWRLINQFGEEVVVCREHQPQGAQRHEIEAS